ncbi:hypothetical protein M422DRAFT_187936 [Sphaerobolus stellatus SS14]|uniref:Protein kinase domain-containing protein n=1 Tax=Sphaerobolus stellatus (strain SS14) TaxID=990650 RepID=A0A0C9TJK8_SPHS4|nr:hypothetical protein M422DRAFT_187936 [Sphaerobolus stellatus SS14]
MCLSPIEVSLEQDTKKERNLLAANAANIFERQVNRRFVFALLLTEETCTVYLFDRSGATYSEPFNFHEDPNLFCAVICLLGSSKLQDIGFDTSFFLNKENLLQVRSKQDTGRRSFRKQTYTILDTIFRSPTYLGRGTFCWLAQRVGDMESRYVIKDAWIAQGLPGKESEGTLLKLAHEKGVVMGIPEFQSCEDVCQSDSGDPDAILLNRKIFNPSQELMKLERIHTRVIMKAYGKTLNEFSSRKELILAFHDAVLAHRNLHQIAGILHRDISARNILINPHGSEGNRGILIDYDNAIRIDDESPYAKKSRVGTLRFMARKLIDKDRETLERQTYLDDLESFYYVLCWIMWTYIEPGKKTTAIPYPARMWDKETAYIVKAAHLSKPRFEGGHFQQYFGKSLSALAKRLWAFLQRRTESAPDNETSPLPEEDYKEFLAEISKGIADLTLEESEAQIG